VNLGEIEITLPGMEHPIYRPHRDKLELSDGKTDTFTELEMINIPGMDGDVAAVGWVLHHGYTGALPGSTLQKGLRLRAGNIQVGDDRLLEDFFPEPRFNSWSVGEIHILDPRIVPNGRRDNFEQNTHYLNILAHLAPVARELSKRCRSSSIRRNRWREFLREVEIARETLGIIKQGALAKAEQARLLREAYTSLSNAERIAGGEFFEAPPDAHPRNELRKLIAQITKVAEGRHSLPRLDHLSKTHRQAYQQVFSLIYECAPNRSVARAIVDRIMTRLQGPI
jgi:molecular chaperone HtpG